MADVNNALLTKTGWEVSEKKNGLWYNILAAKYLRNIDFWHATQKQSDSYFWKGILQTRATLRKGICIQINNGTNTNIWDSPWVPTLSNFIPHPLHGMDQAHPELKVSDIITGNPKQWDLGKMQILFDRESNNEIQKIHIPTFSQLQDKMIWTQSKTGKFIVKSAYQVIINRQSETSANEAQTQHLFKSI
ncbi:hypothetical protein I3760_09G187100 [Carya illinoinensis]|nr:hypothetical protein I3760_09G187100 [Carya illinoinensis]